MSKRSKESQDMVTLVLNVLVGARERWPRMSLREKQKLVEHMRFIANDIELAIGDSNRKL